MPSPTILPLALTLPSVYVNFAHIVFLDGNFRITFMERAIEGGDGPQCLVPRIAITMTPQGTSDLARALTEFLAKLSEMSSQMPQKGEIIQ